jgi:hypothetical protein
MLAISHGMQKKIKKKKQIGCSPFHMACKKKKKTNIMLAISHGKQKKIVKKKQQMAPFDMLNMEKKN